MSELKWWSGIAYASLALGIPMLFWEPGRIGGVFLLLLTCCCLAERHFVVRSASSRTAKWIARVGRLLFAVFLLSFVLVQGMIWQGMAQDAQAEEADVLLVLGARVYPDGNPSLTLAGRLDAAAVFLQTHPQTIAVLCGGQGSNEPCTEASAMRTYLLGKGIADERLLLEQVSNNTITNIANAKALLDMRMKTYHTAVISSDFHLARARRLLLHAGLDAWAIPAPTPYLFQRMALRVREYGSIMGLVLTGRW